MIGLKASGVVRVVMMGLLVALCFHSSGLSAEESDGVRRVSESKLPRFLQRPGDQHLTYAVSPQKQFEIVDGKIILKELEVRPWRPWRPTHFCNPIRPGRTNKLDPITQELIKNILEPAKTQQEKPEQRQQEPNHWGGC